MTHPRTSVADLLTEDPLSESWSPPLAVLDSEGRIVSLNRAAEAMTGFRPEECVGQTLTLFHSETSSSRATCRNLLDGATERGLAQGELSLVHRHGGQRQVTVCISALREENGKLHGFVYLALTTICQRSASSHPASELQVNQLHKVTLASLVDCVITTDQAGLITYLNPAAEAMTDWNSKEAIGRPLQEVFIVLDGKAGETINDLHLLYTEENVSKQVHNPYVLLTRDEREKLSIEFTVAPIRGANATPVGSVIVFREITTHQETMRQLEYQATHDPLTGLTNRVEFERRLVALLGNLQYGENHALLYLDLDQFKIVNDTCGHVAGDELLRQISRVLAKKLRQTDTMARLGGDEFGVLLKGCSVGDARRIAHHILWAIDAFTFAWEERNFKITASVGVAPLTTQQSYTTALSAADSACHIAKELGRNRVHLYQENDRALGRYRRQMGWVPRLQDAIAKNNFRLYLQPIVPLGEDAQSGIKQFEVLLRLIDEQGRIILPGAFIPAAERYHQMAAIDRWVLRAALARLAVPYPNSNCIFSLNLSGQTISQEDFLHTVLEEIDLSGVDPGSLCFEITETAAIGNLDLAIRLISVLRQRGCRFALDDFGVGISSLSYLKNLRVDYLKIDGSFVRGMAKDQMDRALVNAIQQTGQLIGISTIAESIEDAETMEMLRRLGVNYGQGYFIGKPKPIEEVLVEKFDARGAEAAIGLQ